MATQTMINEVDSPPSVAKPLLDEIFQILNANKTRVGDRLGTEVDYAQRYRISRMTVRRALDELVTDGWIERRRGKGLFVRKPMSGNMRRQIIQVIIPDMSLASEGSLRIAHGISQRAQNADGKLLIQTIDGHNNLDMICEIIEQLPESQVSGAIIRTISSPKFFTSLYKLLHDRFPVVMLEKIENMELSYVDKDNYHSCYALGEKLVEYGHQRAAYIGHLRSQHTRQRFNGLRDALNDAGFAWPQERICDVTPKVKPLSDWTPAIERAIDHLMNLKNRPTVIVFNDDRSAAIGNRYLKKCQINVPKDISIVGNGDIELAQLMDPELTTVHHPWEKMGEVAFDMIQTLLNDSQPTTQQQTLPSHVVMRNSVARISNS